MPTTTKSDEVIQAAIQRKRLVKVTYVRLRVLIGTVKLLSYRVAGASSRALPNWQWMEV